MLIKWKSNSSLKKKKENLYNKMISALFSFISLVITSTFVASIYTISGVLLSLLNLPLEPNRFLPQHSLIFTWLYAIENLSLWKHLNYSICLPFFPWKVRKFLSNIFCAIQLDQPLQSCITTKTIWRKLFPSEILIRYDFVGVHSTLTIDLCTTLLWRNNVVTTLG